MNLISLRICNDAPTSLERRAAARKASVTALVLAIFVLPVYAQSYRVIHSFQGSDGCFPMAGVTIDAAGNLYGTTGECGAGGYGTAFKMALRDSGRTFATIYVFGIQRGDGGYPYTQLTRGTHGWLYGTTAFGGSGGWGTVFRLRPSASEAGSWSEDILYNFTGGNDGSCPYAPVIFDQTGNLYSTTIWGAPDHAPQPRGCEDGHGTQAGGPVVLDVARRA